MRALRQLLLVSLLVSFSNGKTKSATSKLSLGSLSSVDLDGAGFDGDILFDLSWPGSEAKQQALQVLTLVWHSNYDKCAGDSLIHRPNMGQVPAGL